MSARGTYEQIRKYLAGQMKLLRSEVPGRKSSPGPVFVTISRQAGAGGIQIGDRIAERLTHSGIGSASTPWVVFERNLLQEVIDQHDLPEDYMKYMEESGTPAFRTVVAEMLNLRPPVSQILGKMNRTILHLASMGNVVIVGRGAGVLTRDLETGLHVRLVGSLDERVRAVARSQKLDRVEVRRYLEQTDAERAAYLNQHFGRDIDDPRLYDLVLNTDRWGRTQVAELVRDALRVRLEPAPR